ncbi:MAG: type III secretion system YscJ/HrcJ family lipoprotein [Alphaproteobacteria bacterium]
MLSACDEAILYKNVEENDANLMTSVLIREGMDATRMANKDGTYNIVIQDGSYFPEAIDALSLRGFPRMKFENLCTIFKGDGMVSTPVEQKARYTCAKAQELSGSLTELDGISMARVHLVLSETDPISRKVKSASASVMIKYKTGMDIDTLIPKVKQLISYAVEELPYQNVSVMLSEEVGRKEAMIAQAFQRPNAEQSQPEETPNLFPNDNNSKSHNMIILYIIMAIMTIGMIIIIFFMLRIKNQQYEHNNLPAEF